jgi:hypothetical protein
VLVNPCGLAANNTTTNQAIKQCTDSFHAAKAGWVVGKGSLLSLIPGYNGTPRGDYLWTAAEWTVLPAAKIGIGNSPNIMQATEDYY